LYRCEASALTYLAQHSQLRFPAVITHGIVESYQYLLLEYIEEGTPSTKLSRDFGRKLAEQHRISYPQFGWMENNYIGRLMQSNNAASHWIDFFLEQRILPLVSMAIHRGLLEKAWVVKLNQSRFAMAPLFPEEPPALLHGDLWGGNYFYGKQGVVVYDPAMYYGHREMDLAMTRLFGGFDRDFYSSYQECYPLDASWMERLPVTQLYPNLVHLNLFGSSYIRAVKKGLTYLTNQT
jgi:protein-ribulosamine 3-kinase